MPWPEGRRAILVVVLNAYPWRRKQHVALVLGIFGVLGTVVVQIDRESPVRRLLAWFALHPDDLSG